MNIYQIYEAGMVRRYHAKRVIQHQTIGEHTWGVCMLIYWLYYPNKPPQEIIGRALFHDVPEIITGDVPAPAKWRSPALTEALDGLEAMVASELGFAEHMEPHVVLSYADNVELLMYALSEVKLGNQYLLYTMEKGL